MNVRANCATAALALLLALSGCSGKRLLSASGRLTYHGQPVPSTQLTFRPADGGRPSHGVTDDDGRFVVTYSRTEKGITRGQHTVTLKYEVSGDEELHKIPSKASKELKAVISKYVDAAASTLHCDISQDGQVIEFEIN
jgi:hypothetical protein